MSGMRQKLISLGLVAAAALLTGTMMVLALPLGEQAWLAWFMLVPLLIATKEKGLLIGFLGGLGAVFWCGFLSTTGVFYHYKTFEPPFYWTYTGCGLFAIPFCTIFGIWSDAKNSQKSIWWFAALAVSLESILLLKLPAPLAITQYRSPLMMVVTSLVGIWGVSFLVWFANLACATRKAGWMVSVPIAIASSVSMLSKPYIPENGLVLAVSQIGDAMDKELIETHRMISDQHPAIDVWPEFAGMNFVRGGDTAKLKELSTDGAPIVTSFRDTEMPLPRNVASLFLNGGESPRYAKRKLFGKETDMHTPGDHAVAVSLGSAQVGLNICYDSCFPYIIRETSALPGVKVVALPTIDPDSLHYFIAAMHASFTPFRSAENGVAIARADGHFGSMVTDPRGRIVAELHDEQGSITGVVSGERRWTLYQVIGDSFWFLCIAVTVLYPIREALKKAKARRELAIKSAAKETR